VIKIQNRKYLNPLLPIAFRQLDFFFFFFFCGWGSQEHLSELRKLYTVVEKMALLIYQSWQLNSQTQLPGYRWIFLQRNFAQNLMINILKTCICICEITKEYTLRNLFYIYLSNKEIYCIFKTCCKISISLSTKCCLFTDLFFLIISDPHFSWPMRQNLSAHPSQLKVKLCWSHSDKWQY
jgi:hypothetical protein